MLTYADSVKLPGSLTLDQRDAIIDKLRERGSTTDGPNRRVDFTIEADDAWDMRGTLEDVRSTLAECGISWAASKSKLRSLERDLILDGLRRLPSHMQAAGFREHGIEDGEYVGLEDAASYVQMALDAATGEAVPS